MTTAARTTRRNAGVLPWLRGAVYGVAALAALGALPFYPRPVSILVAVACAGLGVGAPALGVTALVVALSLPLAAGDLIVGVLFLVVGLVCVQYLGQDDGRAFVVVALAFLASAFHAEWALPALAGYAMGASDGALAALAAALVVEAAGVVLGRPVTGLLATGGATALVDVAKVAATPAPLGFAWLGPAAAAVDAGAFMRALSAVRWAPLLALQPLAWAGSAALAGSLTSGGRRQSLLVRVGGTAAAAALLALASLAAMRALQGPVPTAAIPVAAAASIAVAALVAALGETVFAVVEAPAGASEASGTSLRAEDADVDELLRVIASAEEALEERHAVDAVVMITDMKAFSRMTQEHGTFNTAKLIQRHRDLLLPLIAAGGGHGKSTGGDGLVAAFSSADDALAAAVRMQRTLQEDNLGKPEERRVQIRVGLASGDIIVDRAGCPFIGDGLNLAARVMALADGGQVFATHDVVDATAKLPVPVVSHGEFALKNISRPVVIEEVLWEEGQQPRRPEVQQGAA